MKRTIEIDEDMALIILGSLAVAADEGQSGFAEPFTAEFRVKEQQFITDLHVTFPDLKKRLDWDGTI